MDKKQSFKVGIEVIFGELETTEANVFPKNGAEALEHSIQKYEWVKRWAKKNIGKKLPELGTDTCALCHLYYHNGTCRGCPVKKETGAPECSGTPWRFLNDLQIITQSTLHLIDAEISFLKSLRK